MKYSPAVLVGLAASLQAASAAVPGTVGYDLTVEKKTNDVQVPVAGSHRVRAVSQPIFNEEYYYRINVSIGTPPQQVQLLVDTGSSDTWVLASNDPYCTSSNITTEEFNESNQFDCGLSGTFDKSLSSTYVHKDSDFSIRYGDYTFAKGDFGTDVLTVGDAKVQGMGFGIGNHANSSTGILALGLRENEATSSHYNRSNTYIYDNFPVLLRQQGIINRTAYSIYLNGRHSAEGRLLFGGVDHSKYTGGLWTIPFVNLYPERVSRSIELTIQSDKISLNAGGCASDKVVSDRPLTGLIDTGTTLTYLPMDVLTSIGESFNATWSNVSRTYVQPCSYAKDDMYIDYYFGGMPIRVSLKDTYYPSLYEDGTQELNDEGEKMCTLGFYGVHSDRAVIFGDSFLRSAYLVVDLEGRQVALGQAATEIADEQIEAITTVIPGARPAAEYVPRHTAAKAGCLTEGELKGFGYTLTYEATHPGGVLTASAAGRGNFSISADIPDPTSDDGIAKRGVVLSGSVTGSASGNGTIGIKTQNKAYWPYGDDNKPGDWVVSASASGQASGAAAAGPANDGNGWTASGSIGGNATGIYSVGKPTAVMHNKQWYMPPIYNKTLNGSYSAGGELSATGNVHIPTVLPGQPADWEGSASVSGHISGTGVAGPGMQKDVTVTGYASITGSGGAENNPWPTTVAVQKRGWTASGSIGGDFNGSVSVGRPTAVMEEKYWGLPNPFTQNLNGSVSVGAKGSVTASLGISGAKNIMIDNCAGTVTQTVVLEKQPATTTVIKSTVSIFTKSAVTTLTKASVSTLTTSAVSTLTKASVSTLTKATVLPVVVGTASEPPCETSCAACESDEPCSSCFSAQLPAITIPAITINPFDDDCDDPFAAKIVNAVATHHWDISGTGNAQGSGTGNFGEGPEGHGVTASGEFGVSAVGTASINRTTVRKDSYWPHLPPVFSKNISGTISAGGEISATASVHLPTLAAREWIWPDANYSGIASKGWQGSASGEMHGSATGVVGPSGNGWVATGAAAGEASGVVSLGPPNGGHGWTASGSIGADINGTVSIGQPTAIVKRDVNATHGSGDWVGTMSGTGHISATGVSGPGAAEEKEVWSAAGSISATGSGTMSAGQVDPTPVNKQQQKGWTASGSIGGDVTGTLSIGQPTAQEKYWGLPNPFTQNLNGSVSVGAKGSVTASIGVTAAPQPMKRAFGWPDLNYSSVIESPSAWQMTGSLEGHYSGNGIVGPAPSGGFAGSGVIGGGASGTLSMGHVTAVDKRQWIPHLPGIFSRNISGTFSANGEISATAAVHIPTLEARAYGWPSANYSGVASDGWQGTASGEAHISVTGLAGPASTGNGWVASGTAGGDASGTISLGHATMDKQWSVTGTYGAEGTGGLSIGTGTEEKMWGWPNPFTQQLNGSLSVGAIGSATASLGIHSKRAIPTSVKPWGFPDLVNATVSLGLDGVGTAAIDVTPVPQVKRQLWDWPAANYSGAASDGWQGTAAGEIHVSATGAAGPGSDGRGWVAEGVAGGEASGVVSLGKPTGHVRRDEKMYGWPNPFTKTMNGTFSVGGGASATVSAATPNLEGTASGQVHISASGAAGPGEHDISVSGSVAGTATVSASIEHITAVPEKRQLQYVTEALPLPDFRTENATGTWSVGGEVSGGIRVGTSSRSTHAIEKLTEVPGAPKVKTTSISFSIGGDISASLVIDPDWQPEETTVPEGPWTSEPIPPVTETIVPPPLDPTPPVETSVPGEPLPPVIPPVETSVPGEPLPPVIPPVETGIPSGEPPIAPPAETLPVVTSQVITVVTTLTEVAIVATTSTCTDIDVVEVTSTTTVATVTKAQHVCQTCPSAVHHTCITCGQIPTIVPPAEPYATTIMKREIPSKPLLDKKPQPNVHKQGEKAPADAATKTVTRDKIITVSVSLGGHASGQGIFGKPVPTGNKLSEEKLDAVKNAAVSEEYMTEYYTEYDTQYETMQTQYVTAYDNTVYNSVETGYVAKSKPGNRYYKSSAPAQFTYSQSAIGEVTPYIPTESMDAYATLDYPSVVQGSAAKSALSLPLVFLALLAVAMW